MSFPGDLIRACRATCSTCRLFLHGIFHARGDAQPQAFCAAFATDRIRDDCPAGCRGAAESVGGQQSGRDYYHQFRRLRVAGQRCREIDFSGSPGTLPGRSIRNYLPSLINVPALDSNQQAFRTAMQCRGRREDGEVFQADVWFSTYAPAPGRAWRPWCSILQKT